MPEGDSLVINMVSETLHDWTITNLEDRGGFAECSAQHRATCLFTQRDRRDKRWSGRECGH